MSLAIVFKGPEGIVLAADSRVTLHADMPGGTPEQRVLVPAWFDNATKLLRVAGQEYVGAVTFGVGAIGGSEPRTAHSFIPELEYELRAEKRLSVEQFSKKLSDFFMDRWKAVMPPADQLPPNAAMVFLIGGYDEGAPYGRLFEVVIPQRPKPKEQQAGSSFGALWGGQREIADRLLQGYDDQLPQDIKGFLNLDDEKAAALVANMKETGQMKIPYQFLPLQDCVDLTIMLIRTTIIVQSFVVGVRGVGGAIDVATITRTEGFSPVQQKDIEGERA